MKDGFKSIGQIVCPRKDIETNAQKLAFQFLGYLPTRPLAKFSFVETQTPFLPQLSIYENIMLSAAGFDLHHSQKLDLKEVLERKNHTLLLELLENLPPPHEKPSLYEADEIWCYALIQGLLKNHDYLFIQDDSALLSSERKGLVKKILLQRKCLHHLPVLFTQREKGPLFDIIEYKIFLRSHLLELQKIDPEDSQKEESKERQPLGRSVLRVA
ncbi:MAG: hypothetical protein OXB88_06800 [Bacteriovoracales bacterium]|nr:hypothetical protein [Bacteriovoracales bacterium]